jgi:hypothetical protein
MNGMDASQRKKGIRIVGFAIKGDPINGIL